MKYRKDIDGLRALSIISVICFHLDLDRSGFLGVDIFFVISGYLISSIIIKDLTNNNFSLKNFYLRRMRRILPALIVVLTISTFFAWLILLPNDLQFYSKSLVTSIMSISNILFYRTLHFGYFNTDSSVIPLLHTWSLGIEEQFYVFWPIFFIVFCRRAPSRKFLFLITIILLILSMTYFFLKSMPQYYYSPFSRAFELLIGCCLAVFINNRNQTSEQYLLNITSIASLLLMIFSLFIADVTYPSIWSVSACLGAALFIYAGSFSNYTPLVNRLLSSKILVGIGVISYSLYLWHWPIIAYVNYLSINKTYLVCIEILLISFILSILTYYFIERPFRNQIRKSFIKNIILLLILPIVISMFFMFGSISINGFGFNKAPTNMVLTYYGGSIKPSYNCHTTADHNENTINYRCFFGDINKKQTDILVLGDSHGMAYHGMISVWLKKLKMKGYIYTKSLTDDPKYYGYIIYNKDFIKTISFFINKLHPKAVILAGMWDRETYKVNNSLQTIESAVKFLIKRKITPILIEDVPSLGSIKPTCGLSRVEKLLDMKNCTIKERYLSKNVRRFFMDIKNKYPQAIIINPEKVFCDKGVCPTQINGTNLYFDEDHLSYYGSKIIGEEYLENFKNPLLKI
ncbi:hypothetical protein FRA_34c06320 [Francisella sp. W12-1067]|nr:hypothetical protein FRA_34c06320 [Francisella sp. W12-1067]